MHRAAAVIADWHSLVQSPVERREPVSTGNSEESVAVLRRRLVEANAAVTALQGKLDALASVAANLYHENLALRQQLGTRGIVVGAASPAAPKPLTDAYTAMQ